MRVVSRLHLDTSQTLPLTSVARVYLVSSQWLDNQWENVAQKVSSSPRRDFVDPPEVLPMHATESNRNALEEYIKEHYRSFAFNTCKREHWPVTSGLQ